MKSEKHRSLMLLWRKPRFLTILLGFLLLENQALGQADINNGLVRMGVNTRASLGITPAINPPVASAGPGSVNYLTLRYMPTNGEADSGGALEERWGVADALSSQFGGSVGGGNTNLTLVSFTSTANSAVVTVIAAGIFQVIHDFQPSPHPNAYEITTTIQNISAASVNARYRRAFNWDIEPTNFNEFITIQGSTLPGVLSFTNRGTSGVNPLAAPAGVSGDVLNQGPPSNSGFSLTVDLGTLAPGASTNFRFYYGATADRPSADTVLAALGLNIYAIGHPNMLNGTPNTFFFGFGGGPPPPPPPPPTPGTEGSFLGSSGLGPGGKEGAFGLGFFRSRNTEVSYRVPSLLGPFVDPVSGNTMTVLNVSQRQAEASSDPGQGISLLGSKGGPGQDCKK